MSGMYLKQGKPQQFCQQCGRSHDLDAFDQGRRSCRTQLAKHAARLVYVLTALFHPSLPCWHFYVFQEFAGDGSFWQYPVLGPQVSLPMVPPPETLAVGYVVPK